MLTTVCGSQPALQLAEKRVLVLSDDEVEVQLRAALGWEQNWICWADGGLSNVFRVTTAEPAVRVSLALDPTWATHIVYAFPLGCWENVPGDASLELLRNIVEVSLGVAIDAEWDAPTYIREAYNDSGQLSTWTLTGLERFTNCNRIDGAPTQARLEITLTTVGGVHTLELSAGNAVVARGSRTGDGEITLSAVNNSGLSGKVTLAYSADITAATEAYVTISWPSEYTLAEGSDALAVVADNGYGNRFAAHIDADANGLPLAAGVHNLKLKLKSDANVETAYGSTTPITLSYRTPSPSAPQYLDGDCTDTRISFTTATPAWTASTAKAVRQWVVPSTGPAGYAYECTVAGATHATVEPTWPTTLGATVVDGSVTWTCRPAVTYRVYDAFLDGAAKYEATPTAAAAGSGSITVTLPSIPSASGTRRVHITALCNGVEDLAGLTLDIVYVSGAVYPPGPNIPGFKISSISGRMLTLTYDYDGGWDDVTPTHVKMWLVAEGASPNWSSPDVSQAIAVANEFSRRTSTVAATAAGDGYYRWIVRTADVSGNLSSNVTLIGPRWLGTGVPAVPALTLEASA